MGCAPCHPPVVAGMIGLIDFFYSFAISFLAHNGALHAPFFPRALATLTLRCFSRFVPIAKKQVGMHIQRTSSKQEGGVLGVSHGAALRNAYHTAQVPTEG